MKTRIALALVWIAGSSLITGCGTSVYSVKIPLGETPEAVFADAPHVAIEDRLDDAARETHVGGGGVTGAFICALINLNRRPGAAPDSSVGAHS